jgi:hypothetical protein
MWLLNEQDLDLPDVIVESEKRGISFEKLLTIPENDNWVYSDGKSTSCVVFILEMYKVAGLFDPITSSIQATEFTVSALHVFIICQSVLLSGVEPIELNSTVTMICCFKFLIG